MRQAARDSNSLRAPLASSSTPILDADIPTDHRFDAIHAYPSSCPIRNKTTGLLGDDNQAEPSPPEPEVPRSAVRSNQICEKRGDFYRRYIAHWQFRTGECGCDSSSSGSSRNSSSWGDTQASSCDTEGGGDEPNNNLEQDEVFVDHSRRMASWAGQPDIKGRNETVRMMLLCAVHFGITFTWGVEMTCESSLPFAIGSYSPPDGYVHLVVVVAVAAAAQFRLMVNKWLT